MSPSAASAARATLAALAACAVAGCATARASARDVQMRTLDGQPFDLKAQAGKVVLLDFWATWCEPCKATLPAAQRLADRLGSKGLVAYAVNVEPDAAGARAFLEGLKVTLPVLHDPRGLAAETLGGRNLPFLVIFDRAGQIRLRQEGAPEGGEERAATVAEELLSERAGGLPPPPKQ